jgi:alpha-amylase
MPSGTYCDIISGNIVEGNCTGLTVIVDKSGNANITISTAGDRVVAIHSLVSAIKICHQV